MTITKSTSIISTGDTVDFTKYRLGSREQMHGRKIGICPKCGRKGYITQRLNNRNGSEWKEYTHTGKHRGWCFEVGEWCSVNVTTKAP